MEKLSAPPMRKIKINNVMTNIVGRTKTERIVSAGVWKSDIQPTIDRLLKSSGTKRHKALIGKWVVEYIGNNPHMHEFFVRNWKKARPDAETHVQSYVITGITDREAMMRLLGYRTEEDVRAHLASFRKALENKKYRSNIRDEKLRDIEKFPEKEQLEIALFAPATVYSSADRAFVSLNTNYYGQLKSKSSLGPLEEYLIRKAKMAADGNIANPQDVWLSMHAGSVKYQTKSGERRGIVIIAPTGTGKSTQGYGLVEGKKENRLHSDDWVFVNLGSREAIISEDQFYMRTNIAENYPHLIPLLVCEPLENVAFTPDIVQLLEQFESAEDVRRGFEDGRVSAVQYRKIVEQMIENNAARSLIDPRLMVGKEKFVETTQLTDLFLLKRDFDSPEIIQVISEEKMIEIMTSQDNVFNYDYGKFDPDGYGVAQKPTTEIYYNPYLCISEVEREKGKIGELDKIRIAAYRTLARQKGVRAAWINTRLPAHQTQLCIRSYIEGEIDAARLAKGPGTDRGLLAKLGLVLKEKPAVEGRRSIDLTGFFSTGGGSASGGDSRGREVEIVSFYRDGKFLEAISLLKPGKGSSPGDKAGQLVSYSHGTPEDYLRKNEAIRARDLLLKQ